MPAFLLLFAEFIDISNDFFRVCAVWIWCLFGHGVEGDLFYLCKLNLNAMYIENTHKTRKKTHFSR